jgi:hypothetical protein
MGQAQLDLILSQIALNKAKAMSAEADAENVALDTEQDVSGVDHQRAVELMGAQARGNRNRDVTMGLIKGETTPQNIEAAVGYNSLIERKDEMKAKTAPTVNQPYVPPVGQPALAPLQSAQPQPQPTQGLAIPA